VSKQEVSSRLQPPVELALLVAAGLDLLGEPPPAFHPVIWYGKLIRRLEQAAPAKPRGQLIYGAFMLFLATMLVLPVALLARGLARSVYLVGPRGYLSWGKNGLFALILGGALKPFFALRLLAVAGQAVRLPLEQGDLPAAREALQSLVSRDRSELTSDQAAAATIESLAENLSDSVVAPLFYYTWAGLPGAALYRLYNTFDSMVGYRGRYEYLGKAAARLDDLLNLVPARLTALLIVAAAPLYGGDRRRAWRIWCRDARKTASPNAGQPMSAAAGALGLQLEKVDHYVLGDAVKPIAADDIKRAEVMVWWVGGIAFALALFGRLSRRRWRV
jgi:adenosylcobinamide-phosphate synthase